MKFLPDFSVTERHQAQFRAAQRIAHIGSWELQVADQSMAWSEETYRIFGLDPEQFTHTLEDYFRHVHADDLSSVRQAIERSLTLKLPFDIAHRIVRPDGEVRHVHALGEIDSAGSGPAVLSGTVHDITVNKQALDAALHIAGRLAGTLESITEAFITFDRDWCFTYVNAEAERLLHRPRGELLGKYIWSEFPAAVDTLSYHEYRRARAENVPVFFEQFYEPLGEWLEVRAYPSEEGLAVYFRDVTEHRVGQMALLESEERFKIVAKATADTIWDWDLKTDSMWWNESISTLFGFRPEDLEPDSRSWTNRIHADDKERVLRDIHVIIDGDQEKWSDQYRFRRQDGGYAYVLDRGFVIRNANGEAIRMVGSMTDMSMQKKAEIELARLNRALQLRGACDAIINQAEDEHALLDAVCWLAVDMGGYRLAWIGYGHDDAERSVSIEAHAGQSADIDYVLGLGLSWSETNPLGQGPVGRTLRSGMPLAMEDITQIDFFAHWLAPARKLGFRGVINLPLRMQGRTFGVMMLYSHGRLLASEDEMKLLQELADNLAHGIENIRDRKEKNLIQSAVAKLAASFSVSSGVEFFERLVANMSDAVGSDAGFVSRLLPGEPAQARTVAVVTDKAVRANFDYPLKGAPCEIVLREGECIVTEDLSGRYPAVPGYTEFKIHGYIGRRLDNSAGKPIGLLFVLFRAPIKRVDLIRNTIQIFASRIAAELERLEADARIREQAELLDKAKDAIVVKGMDHKVRFWNKGAERLYKWTAEEAIGRSVDELLFKDPAQLEHATQLLLQHGRWSGETIELRKDGQSLTIENHWTLVADERGAPHSIFAIKTDITQRKADEDAIHRLAFFDPLTSLPNRRLLIERLTARLADEVRQTHNGALLFVDLDNFKILNDSFGHDQGDELLRQVAQRIKACVREHDTVARLGGDEFVIILDSLAAPSLEAATQATLVAEKVLAAFNRPFRLNLAEFHSTPSIGIALFDDTDSANELLKLADMAMYQAKAAGRNTMRFFDPAMQAVVAAKVLMESELRQGLQRRELMLHFQPQVDAYGMVTGAEALARWRHPVRGLVSPLEFIPLAEETGLILPLGDWVLRTACLQLADWATDPVLRDLTLAVNVSARQFRHPDFIERALQIFAETGTDPGKLKLELTESLLVDNVEETIEKMTALKAHGVGFSLDDFGTGYSSLMYLKRLPLDQLKIDQSFVRDILIDPNDAAIARTIVTLGQSLGLEVIAEGVETEEQRALLAEHGCNAYQGYLFSRPVPIAEFDAFVLTRRY